MKDNQTKDNQTKDNQTDNGGPRGIQPRTSNTPQSKNQTGYEYKVPNKHTTSKKEAQSLFNSARHTYLIFSTANTVMALTNQRPRA